MYSQVTSKDTIRPLLMGVHFEKERCYATNTRILVVYNEGSEKHDGLTINSQGEVIQGKFPDVDRVIPKKMPPKKVSIDLEQLYRACTWYLRSDLSNPEDEVLIEDVALRIMQLNQLLSVFKQGKALSSMQMFVGDPSQPAVFKNQMFTAIIMPCNINLEWVDTDPIPESRRTISYANLINTFAFEGWKKNKPEQLDWL